MPELTLITTNAARADAVSEADYREIYLELAHGRTTRQVEAALGSYSNAWWSEFGKGRKPLTPRARAALRQAVGLPELPPAVADVLAGVDPDAEVYRLDGIQAPAGAAAADRVILAHRSQAALLRLDGTGVAVAPLDSPQRPVTPVTPRHRRARGVGTTPATADQNRRRQALGVTWKQIYEAGLAALEAQTTTKEQES